MDRLFLRSLPGPKDDFYIGRFAVTQTVERHSHDFIELAYLESGVLWHICNGREQLLIPGHYFLVDDTVEHTLQYRGEPALVRNCIFRPGFLDVTLRGCRSVDHILKNYLLNFDQRFCFRPHSGEVFEDTAMEIQRILLRMQQEFDGEETASRELLRAYLTELLILTLRKLRIPQAQSRGDIQLLQQEAAKRFDQPIQLAGLAKELHVSLPHLSRKFSAVCGCGFKEYLQRIRMEEACRLLANTEDKVSEVAARIGYQDLKFFNQLFRRYKGITPSEYRYQSRQQK